MQSTSTLTEENMFNKIEIRINQIRTIMLVSKTLYKSSDKMRKISKNIVGEERLWWSFSSKALANVLKTLSQEAKNYYSLSLYKINSQMPWASPKIGPRPIHFFSDPIPPLGSHCFDCAFSSGSFWQSHISSVKIPLKKCTWIWIPLV